MKEGMSDHDPSQHKDEKSKLAAHEQFINENFEPKENKEKKKKKRGFWFYLTGLLWIAFIGGILGFTLLLKSIRDGAFGELPTAEIIENPENPLATVVYTRNGEPIGKYFTENRTNVSYDELSPHLVDALVSTEDERFFKHAGIDFRSLGRVVVRTVLGGDASGGGGSTITQQLAKNLFKLRKIHNDNNIVISKLQEWVIAYRLESKYTKEEILTMYLNTVDFLNNSFGIHSASKTYFNKSPKELNIIESAALVGMLKATYKYNPKSNPQNNKERRATVYAQMVRNGVISPEKKDSLEEQDLSLNYQSSDHNEGTAPYFREQLRQFLHRWQSKTGYDIYRDGLKVYTTIDTRVQEHAEKAMRKHMKYLQKEFKKHWEGRDKPWIKGVSLLHEVRFSQRYNWLIKKTQRKYGRKPTEEDIKKEFSQKVEMSRFSWQDGSKDTVMTPLDSVRYHKAFLQCGMMAVESQTGQILAWVGGLNHNHFKYDHVNINSKRQVGSTFKPFVYLAGIEAGLRPCQKAPNIPVVFDNIVTGYDEKNEPIIGTWDARNTPAEYGGQMTLQQGMATSTNTITAWVMKQIGPPAAVQKARDLGITSPMEAVPSLCLGTAEISVYEMVGAFNAFNNNGLWIEPTYVTKIEDAYGNVLERFIPKSKEAVDPANNYAMVQNFQKVVNRGTGMRLSSSYYYNVKTPLGGKTGTTQEAADGWFIGFEPGITAGVWVGGEERAVHFRDLRQGQGARMAMPVFGEFITAINADSTLQYGDVEEWPKPNVSIPYETDCPFIEYDPDAENEETETGGDINF